MKIDTLALWVIVGGAAVFAVVYLGIILTVSATLSPWIPLLILAVIAPFAFIAYRVLADRLRNDEDDYYEHNVDQ